MRVLFCVVALLASSFALSALSPTTADARTSTPQFVGAPYFVSEAVYTENFPDPSIVYDPGTDLYYAFATTTGGVNVPVMSSPDAVTWTARGQHGIANANGETHDALPDPSPSSLGYHTGDPRWPDELWAPSATELGGRWVLFYALRVNAEGRHCIYYATAGQPDGPYLSPKSLYCSNDPLGSIDPQPYTENGVTYLAWQDQGVVGDHGQRLWARPITLKDSTTVGFTASPPLFLLESEGTWEQWTAENPSLARLPDGRLGLFYSGGTWDSDSYSVGLAMCGPLQFSWTPICQRTSDAPLMTRRLGRKGIGGSTAFTGRNGELYLVNHWWDDREVADYPDNQRRLVVERVYSANGQLIVSGEPGPAVVGTATYVPGAPVRVLDTRTTTGIVAPRKLEAGEVVALDLSAEIPATATAVAVNVTTANADGDGYVTAYPCGQPPTSSNLNYASGQTIPNLVTVQTNASRKICLYTSMPTNLVVDLQGSYQTTAAGGLTGIEPRRLLDTRGTGQVGAATFQVIQVGGTGDVPIDATGAMFNVTSVNSAGPGFLTVWDCDTPLPTVSSVNFQGAAPSPNAVLAKLSATGNVCVYSSAKSDIVVDVYGYTGGSGARFEARIPTRLVDTRISQVALSGGQTLVVPVIGLIAAPVGTTSVTLNVTITGPVGAGWVAAYPCTSPPSGDQTSNLNYLRGETRAAHVTVAVGTDGTVCLRTSQTTHLVVDLGGQYR